MKTKHLLVVLVAVLVYASPALCQVATDSVKTTAPAATPPPAEAPKSQKSKQNYILYGGVTFNTLSTSSDKYESASATGYRLGLSYRAKKFIYWQVGINYNTPTYTLRPPGDSLLERDFSASFLEIPLTLGVNILKATDRVVNLRFFVSVYPSFTLDVDANDLLVTKEDLNSTILFGQAGVGVDVLFLVVEVGYNMGFSDLLKNNIESTPEQAFVNLGFRF